MLDRYGFQGRLNPRFPSQVVVDVCELCNLECIHCAHPAFKKSDSYSGAALDPELNEKMVLEVAERGKGITQFIRYTSNGEPMLHRRIFEILSFASRHSGTKVCLTTNGTLLREETVGRLIDTGIFLIDISLDAASAETYARVRRKGDLRQTEEGVRMLMRALSGRAERPRVVVSFVEQPENRHEIEAFRTKWVAAGADDVIIRPVHSHSGAVAVPPADTARPGRQPCVYPWERITLTPSGQLAYCPTDWGHRSVLADFRHTTIEATWTSPEYERLRAAHLSLDLAAHPFCRDCPDISRIRWPERAGRSYAEMVTSVQAVRAT